MDAIGPCVNIKQKNSYLLLSATWVVSKNLNVMTQKWKNGKHLKKTTVMKQELYKNIRLKLNYWLLEDIVATESRTEMKLKETNP